MKIRCEGDNAGNIAWLRTQPAMHQVEAENDYDGELRQLRLRQHLRWMERSGVRKQ